MASPLPPDHESAVTIPAIVAGSVCHDLKNYLAAIGGYAEIALEAEDPGSPAGKSLQAIFRAVTGARRLCEELAGLCHLETLDASPFDLAQVVREVHEVYVAAANAPEATIELDLPPEPLPIHAVSAQISHLVFALLAFANRAPHPKGIRIALRKESDHSVVLEMIDHLALPESFAASEWFQPLAASAQTNGQISLTLYRIHSLANQNGGVPLAQSHAPQGTRLTVTFPLVTLTTSAPSSAGNPPGRRLNVLMVDDEPFMRSLGMDILQGMGYRVSVASDGPEALDLIRQNLHYFDLVLSDASMPLMTGGELARAIRALRPDIPLVLVSAFVSESDQLRFQAQEFSSVVSKPFKIDDLRRGIERALATTSTVA